MQSMKIETNAPAAKRTVTVTVPFPSSVAEASKVWGEAVSLSLIHDAAVIRVQANARSRMTAHLKKGGTRQDDKTIVAALASYKPTVGRAPADPVKLAARVQKMLARLPEAERAKILKSQK